MKVLVTGASGFLGKRVVASAVDAGHDVRALVRKSSAYDAGSVEVAHGDLRSRRGLDEAFAGVDAVIHCAASVAGDLHQRLAGTVLATENLLATMRNAGVDRIVGVSSYSVYDYARIKRKTLLTEDAPLRNPTSGEDSYAQTKILQEGLLRQAGIDWGLRFTIVRPGVIFGPEHCWTARLGVQLTDRVWMRLGASAPLPLTYVENCADALVACLGSDATVGQTYNVVDDDHATQRRYANLIKSRMTPAPRVIPVPQAVVGTLVVSANTVSRLFFGGRAKLPQILTIEGANARAKAFKYDSRKLREDTGWVPRYSLEEALDRSLSEERLD